MPVCSNTSIEVCKPTHDSMHAHKVIGWLPRKQPLHSSSSRGAATLTESTCHQSIGVSMWRWHVTQPRCWRQRQQPRRGGTAVAGSSSSSRPVAGSKVKRLRCCMHCVAERRTAAGSGPVHARQHKQGGVWWWARRRTHQNSPGEAAAEVKQAPSRPRGTVGRHTRQHTRQQPHNSKCNVRPPK
jgi:hypothetical protein